MSVKLAQMAGLRAAKRLVANAVPGAAVVLGSWANSSATRELARRAQVLYGQHALPARPAQPLVG